MYIAILLMYLVPRFIKTAKSNEKERYEEVQTCEVEMAAEDENLKIIIAREKESNEEVQTLEVEMAAEDDNLKKTACEMQSPLKEACAIKRGGDLEALPDDKESCVKKLCFVEMEGESSEQINENKETYFNNETCCVYKTTETVNVEKVTETNIVRDYYEDFGELAEVVCQMPPKVHEIPVITEQAVTTEGSCNLQQSEEDKLNDLLHAGVNNKSDEFFSAEIRKNLEKVFEGFEKRLVELIIAQPQQDYDCKAVEVAVEILDDFLLKIVNNIQDLFYESLKCNREKIFSFLINEMSTRSTEITQQVTQNVSKLIVASMNELKEAQYPNLVKDVSNVLKEELKPLIEPVPTKSEQTPITTERSPAQFDLLNNDLIKQYLLSKILKDDPSLFLFYNLVKETKNDSTIV